jgi:hypothetical protein
MHSAQDASARALLLQARQKFDYLNGEIHCRGLPLCCCWDLCDAFPPGPLADVADDWPTSSTSSLDGVRTGGNSTTYSHGKTVEPEHVFPPPGPSGKCCWQYLTIIQYK